MYWDVVHEEKIKNQAEYSLEKWKITNPEKREGDKEIPTFLIVEDDFEQN